MNAAEQGTHVHKIIECMLEGKAVAEGIFGMHTTPGIPEKSRLQEITVALANAFARANPHPTINYGENGPYREAWFRGFNRGMAEGFGLKLLPLNDSDPQDVREARNGIGTYYPSIRRFTSHRESEEAARKLTESYGVPFWAEDRGEWCHPRLAVMRAFQIGEPVSYGFNGDSYVAGRISGFSGAGDDVIGYRIITVEAPGGLKTRYYRRKLTGSWVNEGGTWTLQHGWHNDRNPHF